MDAVKFIEERDRMCKSFGDVCKGCPAWDGSCKLETGTYLKCEADEKVKIVEQWSAAHPRKTRQSVFLEQWPEAKIDKDGCLDVCPYNVSATHRDEYGCCVVRGKSCDDCRHEFWMQEAEKALEAMKK